MRPVFKILAIWFQGGLSVAFLVGSFMWALNTDISIAYRIFNSGFCLLAVFGVNYFCVRCIERMSTQPTSIVYMPLEKEGTECFRPIVAHRVSEKSWKVDPGLAVPETEEWKFQPDEEIEIENRVIRGIRTPIASKLSNPECEPVVIANI